MGFIEEDSFRDNKGRLISGHKGLKPKGANSRLPQEIKKKITEFLAGELESISEIYKEVTPKDKLRFLTELMGYVLPKSKELLIENINTTQEADLSRLSEETLKELISIQTKIENELLENENV